MTIKRVKVATGHNNTGGYQEFTVPPWTPRLIPGIRRIAVSGKVNESGYPYTILRWDPKVPDSVNTDVRTKTGLTAGIAGADVTIYLPTNENRDVWDDFNGYATMPDEAEFERRGWKGLAVYIYFLEAVP